MTIFFRRSNNAVLIHITFSSYLTNEKIPCAHQYEDIYDEDEDERQYHCILHWAMDMYKNMDCPTGNSKHVYAKLIAFETIVRCLLYKLSILPCSKYL